MVNKVVISSSFLKNQIHSIKSRHHITGGSFIQRFFWFPAGSELFNDHGNIPPAPARKRRHHSQMTGNRQLFSFADRKAG